MRAGGRWTTRTIDSHPFRARESNEAQQTAPTASPTPVGPSGSGRQRSRYGPGFFPDSDPGVLDQGHSKEEMPREFGREADGAIRDRPMLDRPLALRFLRDRLREL